MNHFTCLSLKVLQKVDMEDNGPECRLEWLHTWLLAICQVITSMRLYLHTNTSIRNCASRCNFNYIWMILIQRKPWSFLDFIHILSFNAGFIDIWKIWKRRPKEIVYSQCLSQAWSSGRASNVKSVPSQTCGSICSRDLLGHKGTAKSSFVWTF